MSEYTALEGEEPQAEKKIPPAKNHKNKVAGAAFFVIVLLIVGALVYFKFFRTTEEVVETAATPSGIYNNRPKSGDGRRFDFPDEDAPPPPGPAQGTATVSTTTTQPTPPANNQATTATVYTPTLPRVDKSASSMVPGSSSGGGRLGLGGGSGSSGGSSAGSNPKLNELSARAEALQKQMAGQSGGGGSGSGINLFNPGGGTSELGKQLQGTKTERAYASSLGNRDFLLAKGSYIDCVLNTRINSSVAGMTKCTLTHNIYSDNGNILLLERGSTVTGEYKAGIGQGQTRLFMLWDRVKTPSGIVVDLSSSATDPLGGSGVEGYIDTHFWTRFGGAMMLSLIDDTAAYIAAKESNDNTVRFESTSDASQNMAAEALKNTINIPATLSKNQGDRVGIFVARDIDFSPVYKLAVKQQQAQGGDNG